MYPSNKKKKVWREEKERLLKMTLEERRKEYIRDYVPLSTIVSWKEEMRSKGQNDAWEVEKEPFSDLVFQSIVNQERLIEDSFEKSLL